MKSRIKPRLGKYILITAIIVGLSMYALRLNAHTYWGYEENPKGRALVATINLAFGHDNYFDGYQPFANDYEKHKRISGCKNKKPSRDNCALASMYGSENVYLKNCATWRFQQCSLIRVSASYVYDDELKDDLMKLLSKPCSFLPNNEVISAKEKELEHARNHGLLIDVRQFKAYRKSLGCESKNRRSLKIIIEPDTGKLSDVFSHNLKI